LLKLGGRFFFAAYSPKDERMGTLRHEFNRRLGLSEFKIYLEDAPSYEEKLRESGFVVDRSEVINAVGYCQPQLVSEPPMKTRREFILIVARKP